MQLIKSDEVLPSAFGTDRNLTFPNTDLVVKPTVHRIAKVGDASSISDERNNIHWFVANSAHAFTLDVIMLDLGGKQYDIQNIDIRDGEILSDGLIRAAKMDVDSALKKYGKESHH